MQKIKDLVKNNMTFIKYIVSAGLSFGIDLICFTILNQLVGDNISTGIIIATIGARIISSIFNYFANKKIVFKDSNKTIQSLIKYYILVVIQMCVSGILVTFVYNRISIPATIIKIPVEIILFIMNYLIQKCLIFKTEKIDVTKFQKNIEINPKISAFVLAIMTAISLTMKLDKNLFIYFYRKDTNAIVLLLLAIFLYYVFKTFKNKYKSNRLFNRLALTFSIFLTLFYSFDAVGDAGVVFGGPLFLLVSVMKVFSFYQLLKIGINYIYDKLCNYKITDISTNKESRILTRFEKETFAFCFLVMLLCYIPYIIAYYPAVLGPDPNEQIKEVMGMQNRYMDSIVLIDNEQPITNFNPVLHTLLLGNCFKLGHMIGNDNIGLFFYVLIQTIFMLSVLSYAICYLKKEGVSNKLLLIILGIFSFVPIFPFYAINTNKDLIFSLFVLLYVIKLYDFIKYPQKMKDYFILLIIMICVCLTRNNGIYTILFTLPPCLIWLREKRKVISVLSIIILAFYGIYGNVILPAFKVTNTSIREMLSIPFQQTARLAKYYPEEFSDTDKEIVHKIIDMEFEEMREEYNPELSDAVKYNYNRYATSEDLKEYFKVWYRGLITHPGIYLSATIHNTYGYFYPNTSNWYVYNEVNSNKGLREVGFDYCYIPQFTVMRIILNKLSTYYQYSPILGLFVNCGFVGWVYLFLFVALIVKKKYQYLPMTFVALSFMLVNIAGPANTYFRYALPYIMSLPIVGALFYGVFQEKDD